MRFKLLEPNDFADFADVAEVARTLNALTKAAEPEILVRDRWHTVYFIHWPPLPFWLLVPR